MSRKPKFYVGQIIRRKTLNGPIGPYMVIEHIEEDKVYASMIGSDTPNNMFLKKNVYTASVTSLAISEHQLMQLRKGRMYEIQHPATKKWQKVFDNVPELITFYTITKNYSSTFMVERVTKIYYNKETMIRIILGICVI